MLTRCMQVTGFIPRHDRVGGAPKRLRIVSGPRWTEEDVNV